MEEVCLEVYLVLVGMVVQAPSRFLQGRFEICKRKAAWFLAFWVVGGGWFSLLQVLGVCVPVLIYFVCHSWNLHD